MEVFAKTLKKEVCIPSAPVNEGDSRLLQEAEGKPYRDYQKYDESRIPNAKPEVHWKL